MESSEFYSELKAKGLQLANHDGKLRVGPKEKLTKEDRELLKVLKEELLKHRKTHHLIHQTHLNIYLMD